MNDKITRKTMTATRQLCLALPLLLTLLLLVQTTLVAQTFRGAVSGTINDDAGAVLPGVSVKVMSKATGATRHVETGKDGDFLVPDLAATSARLV